MDNNNKHIDKLAKDRLSELKVTPPDHSWDKLSLALGKRNKVILLKQIAIAAASILLLFSAGYIFLLPENKTAEVSANNLLTLKLKDLTTDHLKIEEPAKLTLAPSSLRNIRNSVLDIPLLYAKIEDESSSMSFVHFKTISELESAKNELKLIYGNDLNKKHADDFDWNDYKIQDNEAEIKNAKRLKIGFLFSPGYTSVKNSAPNNFEAGPAALGTFELARAYTSTTHNNPNGNTKTVSSFSYGLNVSFPLSKKWSIISGINYFNYKNEIGDMVITGNADVFAELKNLNTSFGNVLIDEGFSLASNSERSIESDNIFQTEYQFINSIVQDFRYIEVPLLFSYNLLQRKFGLSVLGGVNAGVLVENQIYASNQKSKKIGETEGVSKWMFKTVVGFSMDYPIIKNIHLSLSPSYKYQLNEFNKTSLGSQRIQFFDISTSISFHF